MEDERPEGRIQEASDTNVTTHRRKCISESSREEEGDNDKKAKQNISWTRQFQMKRNTALKYHRNKETIAKASGENPDHVMVIDSEW